MKALNIVVIVLAVLAMAALGGAAVGLAFSPERAARAHEIAGILEATLAASGPFLGPLLGLAGALLMSLAVLVAWGNLASRRFERIVVLRNPLGEVMVSMSALEDLGRLVKSEVPGLKDIKLRVSASRRGLAAHARVVLQGDVDLPAVTEAVQAAIRKRLQNVVGAEQDIRPRVMVGKVLVKDPDSEELLLARARMRRQPRP
jgi:hypothetical protein